MVDPAKGGGRGTGEVIKICGWEKIVKIKRSKIFIFIFHPSFKKNNKRICGRRII